MKKTIPYISLLLCLFLLVSCGEKGLNLAKATPQELEEALFVPAVKAGLTTVDWDDPQKIQPDMFAAYYGAKALADSTEETIVDAETVEAMVTAHFSVVSMQLRTTSYYQRDTGDYAFKPMPEVKDIELTEAKIEEGQVTFFFEYLKEEKTYKSGTLLVEILGKTNYKKSRG